MSGERLDVVRGSGNVFRDLGVKNADVLQLKALFWNKPGSASKPCARATSV